MGDQRHAQVALPPGKTWYPLYRRIGGPQGRSGLVRKISPPIGIRSPDCSARSESLYRLKYHGPHYYYYYYCHSVLDGFQRVGVTGQALPIHDSAKPFGPHQMYLVLPICFCFSINTAERRVSSFELSPCFIGGWYYQLCIILVALCRLPHPS